MAPNACVLSLTAVTDEPRVRRQCAVLLEHGWTVTVAGYSGRSGCPDGWTLVEIDRTRYVVHGPWRVLGLAGLSDRIALWHFWRQPGNRHIYDRLRDVRCDLVIAHDYYTAPIAQRLGRERAAPYIVDNHEYARAQFAPGKGLPRHIWTIFMRPYIDALSRWCLSRAALTTTVCDGIADLLQRTYRLAARPIVLRGTPSFEQMPFNRTGSVVRVLYHGLLVPTRGLEQAILSVRMWRPEFRLVIRGIGKPDYIDGLRRLAAEQDVADRVEFADPVPFADLVSAANQCDIGYVVLENYSEQREFTLPNKFFEYIMAGLALCVSDLPELARIVRQYDLGLLVSGVRPDAIAAAVNSLSREKIDEYKQRSLAAARELCWERESRHMRDALGRIVPGFDAARPSVAALSGTPKSHGQSRASA